MANLIDMKLPKKTKEDLKKEGMVMLSTENQEQWPYGLQIRFEKEEIDKMPSLINYKVGDMVILQAEARVTSISMSERQSGKEDHSVGIQIEKVSVELAMKKSMEKMSPREYREERENKK